MKALGSKDKNISVLIPQLLNEKNPNRLSQRFFESRFPGSAEASFSYIKSVMQFIFSKHCASDSLVLWLLRLILYFQWMKNQLLMK